MRLLAFLLIAALALLAFAPAASTHKIVGRDGKIHACYMVKGKPRGALRVVRSRKVRCRRGERKVAWAVAAVSGATGAGGVQGTQGAEGPSGDMALTAKLTEQVDSLSARVGSLEATLAGVTNADLLAAVDSLPAIDALCEQSEDLTEQVNLLQDAVGGLGLSPGLEALGVLEIPALPEPLEPFSCPAP